MTQQVIIPRDLLEQLVGALDKLARLGNEPHFGNSDGNVIAQGALTAGRAALERVEPAKNKPHCKECAAWVKALADNREWIAGVAEGARIVRKLAEQAK